MSKKRRDTDFIGDIQEAMGMSALYTKDLTFRKLEKRRMRLFAISRSWERL